MGTDGWCLNPMGGLVTGMECKAGNYILQGGPIQSL